MSEDAHTIPSRIGLDDPEILHIFKEVIDGRNQHGSFLRMFAATLCLADPQNFALMRTAAHDLIQKYKLGEYLDTYGRNS